MKKSYLLLLALAPFASNAQDANNIIPGEAALRSATTANRNVVVRAITPNIIRVDNFAGENVPQNVQSVLPLVAEHNIAHFNSDGSFTTDAGIRVTLDAEGLLIQGTTPGSAIFDIGTRSNFAGKNIITLGTSGNASFYGAGERGHKLNLAGDTLVMYNRQNYGYTGTDSRINQMNITMPLILSNNGYAIVFDDFAAAKMVVSNPIEYSTESSEPITYYYVGGVDNLADLTERLTELTGRQPLPPLWSLGYITSKYGYHDQAETEAVIDTLKTNGYPVDGIVLDLYWYGKEADMGRLEWDPEQWPDAKGMLERLNNKGVKTVAISQPYVLRNGRAIDNYNTLAPLGMFVADTTGAVQEVKIWVGEGGMFDVSNPDTRSWLKNRYKALTDMGMGGWWGDLGEPEVHPENAIHANGLTTRLYHNKYGNDWSSIISELYAEQYPDRRLMTLMRGGTTGLQRHCVFPWSTDVSRSWGGLEPQIRIMLNSGLSGMGYMSSDLGGFAVDPANPYLPELYIRWVEAGLFSPVFRTHATQYAEPYHYPMYADALLDIVKERYRWLPYNYTLAYENSAYGWPLVRPLDFHQNANGQFDNISDQYLWGENIMVAPVITEGTTERKVVFPNGDGWYSWHDATYYAGGTAATVSAPVEHLPLFVRAGAIIPTANYPMENTGDYRPDTFTLNFFPHNGADVTSYIYDDNRTTPGNIENNEYRLVNLWTRTNNGKSIITVTTDGTYTDAPAKLYLNFAVRANSDAKVAVNGNKINSTFDAVNSIISFSVEYTAGDETNITISYKK